MSIKNLRYKLQGFWPWKIFNWSLVVKITQFRKNSMTETEKKKNDEHESCDAAYLFWWVYWLPQKL